MRNNLQGMGAPVKKKWDVWFPYKQVSAFRSMAHKSYIFPILLNPFFRFFKNPQI